MLSLAHGRHADDEPPFMLLVRARQCLLLAHSGRHTHAEECRFLGVLRYSGRKNRCYGCFVERRSITIAIDHTPLLPQIMCAQFSISALGAKRVSLVSR